MKRLLILLALAGLSAAACGDDDDKGGTPTPDAGGPDAQVAQDAGGGNTGLDAAVVLVSNVGAQCSASSTTDCTGGSAQCLTTVAELNATFQGGYCTATCSTNAECGANGGCPLGEAAASFGSLLGGATFPGNCMLRCTATTECRAGYTCTTIAASIPALGSNPLISAFLPPSLSEKYCLPPVSIAIPDGGFQLPPRDSGTTDAGATDAGNTDAGGSTDAGATDAGDDGDAATAAL